MNNRLVLLIVFAVLVLFEVLGLTYFQKPVTYFLSSWIYFFAGLATCGLTFYFAATPQMEEGEPAPKLSFTPALLLAISVFAYFFVINIGAMQGHIAAVPIDYRFADMLPQIKASCEKFLAGEKVYAPVQTIWGGQSNPYLPAMWMPFLPSVIWGFDMRWTTFVLLFAGLAISMVILVRVKGFVKVVPVAISLLALDYFIKHYAIEDSTLWRFTQEGAIVFYYLLLVFALYFRNVWLVAIAIILCALSRYSISFFVPAFFVLMLLGSERKTFLRLTVTGAILFAAIFFIPFFLSDPAYFLSMPNLYLSKTADYWKAHDYNTRDVMGPGLFKFFAYRDIHVLQKLQYITVALLPFIGVGVFVWLKKKRPVDIWLWAMGMLKLTLVFFYNFLVIPFPYLFIIPTLISFPILYSILAKQKQ